MSIGLRVIQLAVPRENEYSPDSAASLFGSLLHLDRPSWLKQKLWGEPFVRVSLETVVVAQRVHFFAVVNEEQGDYWESQFMAAYPLGVLGAQEDYLNDWQDLDLQIGVMGLSRPYYYPLKTYKEFGDVDPMALALGVMSKAKATDVMCVQVILTGAGNGWRSLGEQKVKGVKKPDGTSEDIPGKSIIATKLAENAFWATMRIAANTKEGLSGLASALGTLSRGDGNALKMKRPGMFAQAKWRRAFFERTMEGVSTENYLSVTELATVWHMPNKNIKLQNLTWAKNLETEAPDNLPVYKFLSEEVRDNVNFFGKTNFRGEEMVFGIKREDRTRHMYVIGKSGVGKSTLLENMAINDMKKGEGMAFLDPHGSSVELLLNYIPKNRINDVVYFDPSDVDLPIPLNILEVSDPSHREFVASGIVSIFAKLYDNSWGPRLEYILRNTLLTLTEVPGTTLPNVLDMLTNKAYRQTVVYPQIKDPVMMKFWLDEFDRLEPRQQTEATASILNKVGQFVSSPMIRKIISAPKSSMNLEDIMNDGKILLVNLSQGKMGEDNSALMGAMIITKIQLSAMRRAQDPERKWRDFFLYVDEFQNFATSSFIKILSEARKYRLGLILANQYVGQIGEDIMAAVKGNAGTLVNFLVGADDAATLVNEYAGAFEQGDLVSLGRGEVVVKLAIDGLTSRAFFAKTLPPAASKNQSKDKVIRLSRERWGRKYNLDEFMVARDPNPPEDKPKWPKKNKAGGQGGGGSQGGNTNYNRQFSGQQDGGRQSREGDFRSREDARSSDQYGRAESRQGQNQSYQSHDFDQRNSSAERQSSSVDTSSAPRVWNNRGSGSDVPIPANDVRTGVYPTLGYRKRGNDREYDRRNSEGRNNNYVPRNDQGSVDTHKQ